MARVRLARTKGLRVSIEDMHGLAQERGGECLSQEYVNNLTKMQWRCGHGHEWSTTLATILADYWCPECAWLVRSTEETTWRKYPAVKAEEADPTEDQRV
jgi:hypothetical protein